MIDPSILPSGAGPTGVMPLSDVEELRKALEAGQTYNIADASGGQALRIQSLDHTMQAVIQENRHFRLFNALPKPKATATVDEWTEQSGVGGFLGGSTNTEVGTINEATGTYTRRVGLVKYLMTRRQVSFVMSLQNNLIDAEAAEYANGALQLLTDAEYLCFEGDASVVSSEFSGVWAQMRDGVAAGDVPSDHILDARAQSLASINLVNTAAATISAYGNFGTPTDLFLSQLVQADFDNGLDPAFRVPLPDVPNGGISLGAPVAGIRTSWGNIKNQPDVFIPEGDMLKPFSERYSAIAAANAAYAGTMSATNVANNIYASTSKFATSTYGDYHYAIAAIGQNGESAAAIVNATAVTVDATHRSPVITITHGTGTATGYAIYRGRRNDSSVSMADFRLVKRIPRAAGATTAFYDLDVDVPGTSRAYILNLTPSATAITWRQMLPMVKFPLYPTVSAIIPWAQMLFGYLRISKRKHIVVINNILPDSATWNPYTV